ncbi:MAG: NAD(P)/FAD-dependent oxidoreductase [Candidatus Aenigmarchaeota archaeon]|nr:NAD(P)/FAD-dependent oxidoreductase [Candidatus Aenigmarchaeota archaeon]
MESYDIVVIGAGPAGSSAAMATAKAGLKVLMVEKRAEIGSPKRCGEGLSKSALGRMGLELEESWVRRTILGASTYAPNGKKITVNYKGPEGWVIERKVFDKWLAKKAVEAGARVIAKTDAVSVIKKDGKVSGVTLESNGKRWDVQAKVLIAADGVESKIAREAGIDTTLRLVDVASGVQFEMAGVDIDPDRIELYFGNEIAPAGYAWIFPKGKNQANVGIGVRKPWAKKTAYEYLMDFVESRPGLKKGSIVEINGGGVPVGALMKNMVADNFMVVGDAAHQVNPIHGGGIGESFVAGRIAAQVAVQAIRKGDCSKKSLSEYNKIWWKERGEKLQKLVRLREVTESLKDEELNWLAEYLQGEDLIELVRSSGFKKLAFLFMKKPRLMKLARKLL